MKVTVRVPATSANLGPGFDALGIAWDIYCRTSFEEGGEGLRFTGCDTYYSNEYNLAYIAYKKTLDVLGVPLPTGLAIDIDSSIPMSRGLGSSASLTVAGIMAANRIHGGSLTRDDMLQIACKLEGHPDNVAPALFGALCASTKDGDRVYRTNFDISSYLQFLLYIPDFEVSTAKARALMPTHLPTDDAVYSLGRLPLLLKGFENGSPDLLRVGLSDMIHQPYRKQLIHDFDFIHDKAIELGADGLVISGSGSTLLSVGGGPGMKERMQSALSGLIAKWEVVSVRVDRSGAVIEEG